MVKSVFVAVQDSCTYAGTKLCRARRHRFGGCHWRSSTGAGGGVGLGGVGWGVPERGQGVWGGGGLEASRLKKGGSPHGHKRECAFRTQAGPQDYGGP